MLGFLLPKLAWFAFIAVAPIAIHLLNRIRLRRVPFSSLIFLKEVKRERFNWLRLKELLLLVLRTALILFLFLGLSRPFLRSGLFGVKREASTVVIVDNSGSMRHASAAERAVRGARDYLSQLTGTSEAAVITSTDPGSGFLTRDIRRLSADLDSIRFSYSGTDLVAALEQARALLSNAALPQREIVIFTDLQKRAIAPVPAIDDRRVTVAVRDCGSPDWANSGVASVSPLEFLPEPGKPTGLTARIWNYGVAEATRTVTLKADATSETKSLSIPAGSDKAVDFDKQLSEPGDHPVSVALDPDSLTADDTSYSVVRIPSRIPVLIAGDAPEDYLYLAKALAPESLGFFDVETRLSSNLRGADLRRYRVVGLMDPVNLSNFDWQRIDEYLRQGGSLFVALSREPKDPSFIDRYVSWSPEASGSGPVPSPQPPVPGPSSGFVTIEHADFSHPILEAFKDGSDLSLPRFFRHARVEPKGAATLAAFSDGAPFLLEARTDRVIIATSALRLDATDLPFRGLFLPLAHRIFSYLSQEQSSKSYVVGDTIIVPAPSIGLLKVKTPQGEFALAPEPGAGEGPSLIKFGATDAPGVYQLGERSYAVNFPPGEGDLTRVSGEDLAKKHISILQDSKGKTRDLTNTFLIIAGLCLAAEMLVLVL